MKTIWLVPSVIVESFRALGFMKGIGACVVIGFCASDRLLHVQDVR